MLPLPPTRQQHQDTLPRVSFDTSKNPAAFMFLLILRVGSEGYARTPNTQSLDELIVLRGLDKEILEKEDHTTPRTCARAFLVFILLKSRQLSPDSRRLSILLEYVPEGHRYARLTHCAITPRLGTRGRRAWQNMGMEMGIGMCNVSKHYPIHSPVPIIVGRPERKVKKVVEKPRAGPKRGRHFGDMYEYGLGIELMV
ncbi:hypothetical protein BD779DRAFT_1119754 [Infundibulicybe gibba]|nr:hypothetical protein BD779DRAFT_1119754 [Infundibulicybe gibba]